VIEEVCRRQQSELHLLGRDFDYAKSKLAERDGQNDPKSAIAAIDVRTPWRAWNAIPVPLPGEHQAANTAIAVCALDVLSQRGWNVSPEAVSRGLPNVNWPLRIEVLSQKPTVVIDAAHNWESMAALLRTLDASFAARRRVLVFSASRDKDVAGLLRQAMPRFDTVILTQYQNNPRALPIESLRRIAQTVSSNPVHLCSDPPAAWKLAKRLVSADDLVCVAGSFFIAGEMREIILDELRRGADAQQPMGQLLWS
jgi:dihydrofolate synthase/folylpolyglutamate synthase